MIELNAEAQEAAICEDCDERRAHHHCLTCAGHLCDQCKNIHERKKISSSHKIVSLTSDLLVYGNCSADHPKYKYEVFCKLCDVPVCMKCNMEEHNGHDTEEIQATYSRKRKFIMQQITNIENVIIPKKKEKLHRKKCELEELTKATETLKFDMIEQSQKLIENIKYILETNLEIIHKIQNVEIKDIYNQVRHIEREIEGCKQTKSELEMKLNNRVITDFLLSNKGLLHVDFEESNDVSYTLPKFVPNCLDKITAESYFGIVILPQIIRETRVMESLDDIELTESYIIV